MITLDIASRIEADFGESQSALAIAEVESFAKRFLREPNATESELLPDSSHRGDLKARGE